MKGCVCMFKILDLDRKMIERKYHNPDKEFDGFNRMEYHGYDYDEGTGLSDVEMDKGLEKLSNELEGSPHPIHKAKLFEYVLTNTRIDIAEHDYFIGIYSWGRCISKYTVFKWCDEVYKSFPEQDKLLYDYAKSGTAYGWLDFDHTVPDWDSLMELGFRGVLERARAVFEKIENPTEKQIAFFSGVEIEYNAIIAFLDRLYKYASTKNFEKATKIAECIKNLRDGAPTDSYEALQMIYIYFMLSESVEHYQVRSLGHGLDQSLYPFFKKDIESGKYTKEEIGELIGYFLMQWSAIGNYWGQPMYLGGTKVDGTTRVTELSYLILDVYDKLGIYNPKIQIKYHNSTPKEFIEKALEMIRHGASSIVFCNEDHIVKSLMSLGATYEEAIDSVISGCYEYKVKAKGIAISTPYFNALKPISFVFDNGLDTVTDNHIGIKTGDLSEFTTFEQFYNAYLSQFKYCFTAYVDAMCTMETKVQEINPSLMFSATCPDCINSMTDAMDGGLENYTEILLCALGSAVDALMAVYELVFEKKVTTLENLKNALDANWKCYEDLRKQAVCCTHKYGNGDAMADYYANAITRFAYDLIASKRNSHNGRFKIEMHSARAFIVHGEATKATPDGRFAGDETSKNASPSPGADRNGITALINSATTIDTSLCQTGFCLDAMLHPSAVQGENGMTALYSVLKTYMDKGGASIHFNIFNTEILRDAQKNPEKYKNLQVRICGWNALWNKIPKSEQDAYILRCENIK